MFSVTKIYKIPLNKKLKTPLFKWLLVAACSVTQWHTGENTNMMNPPNTWEEVGYIDELYWGLLYWILPKPLNHY